MDYKKILILANQMFSISGYHSIPEYIRDACREASIALSSVAEEGTQDAEYWEKTAKNWERNWNSELELRKVAEARAEKAERERDAAEAANSQLDGTVTTLMESNRRMAEELKAHSETELAKSHEALSADWAKQKMRAEKAETERDAAVRTIETIIGAQKYCALCKHAACKNSEAIGAACKPIWNGLE